MNKQLFLGLGLGALVATAGGAFALRQSGPDMAQITSIKPITAAMEQEYAEVTRVEEMLDPNAPQFAEVVDVEPMVEKGRSERVCENVVVTRRAPARDSNQITGTVTGAVLGGVLGNQVGGGNGRKVATAAGAVVGGLVGKKVQANHQSKQTYQTTERQCRTEKDTDQIKGYQVTYEFEGQRDNVELNYKPGKQLPILNGVLVTDQEEARQLTLRKMPSNYEVYYQAGLEEGSLVMPKAPNIGTKLLMENGQVITDPQRLSELKTHQNQVVAYRVAYRLEDQVGEVRLINKPQGNTLPLKDGQPVLTGVNL